MPSALDCTIPQNAELITPEEREELRVSGENSLSSFYGRTNITVIGCLHPGRKLSSHAAFSFSAVKLFLTEPDCSSVKNAVDMSKCLLKPLVIVQFFPRLEP